MLNKTHCTLRASVLLVITAALILSGCQLDNLVPNGVFQREKKITIEATYEIPEMDTKTVRDDNAKIYWTPGDAISLFYDSGTDGGSKFVAQNDVVALKTTFAGYILAITGGSDMDEDDCYFWGLYPYDKNASCDGHTVTMSIKSVQKGMEDTFAPGMAPSLGRSKQLAIPFRNIWSGFGFTVSEPGYLSVTFRGNGGEELAGRAKIGMDENGLPKVVEILDGIQEVTLKAPTSEGFVPGKYYYMQFYPGTFSNGFTVTVASAEKEGEYVYSKEMVYPRSTWKRAANVDTRVEEWNSVDKYIVFADEKVKSKLVAAFDTDEDGEISYPEAAAATSIEGVFGAIKTYKSFDEFQYFTGVTSIPASMFASWNLLTSIVLPESITQIGNDAFNGCVKLSSIVIPNNVASIPPKAFYNCNNLQFAEIAEGMTSIGSYAFSGCSSLTSVVIPESVTSIGQDAFYGCISLSSVIIPESVTSIGGSAFYGCSSLSHIELLSNSIKVGDNVFFDISDYCQVKVNPSLINFKTFSNKLISLILLDGTTAITNQLFSGCIYIVSVIIPESVTSIGKSAFSGCSSLTSVVIPESVTSIGESAFRGCSSLTSVVIPESVTSIRQNAFDGCSNLSSVVIPESVTSIGSFAFYGCSSLSSVVIPEGVTSISSYTFDGCSNLSSVVIPESVTSIGEFAFSGCSSLTSVVIPESVTSIGESAFSGCSSLSSVVIPEGVTSISSHTFDGCSNLSSVIIPESVTSIGVDAFAFCSSLSSVIIPESVTSIGVSTFHGCSNLSAVVIPEGMTSIGDYAFYYCSNLNSITILAANPPELKQHAFDFTNNCPIYVPSSSLNTYLSVNSWKIYANRIQAIPE